jgi:3-oxoacyl-[acyl-carrier protein] reductase
MATNNPGANDMRLDGKIAVVTGAGSGFGDAIAKRFAEEGAMVVVNDLQPAGGERVVRDIVDAGGEARFVHGNVSREADVRRLVQSAIDAYGGLHIFVNNAGYTHRNQPLLDVTEEQFDRTYAINVKSLFWSAKYAVPHFRRHGGGVFITIASTAGVRPRPGLTWYNGSKGAAIAISRSMAAELGPEGIRVNCINPVIGETGMLSDVMGEPDTPDNRAKFIASIPLGRLTRPLDVANAALFLASDEAQFITGACLEVDGGYCA